MSCSKTIELPSGDHLGSKIHSLLVDGANGLGVDVENLEFALVLLVTSMSAIERLSGDHAEVLDGVARVHPWQEGRLTLEAHAAPKLHHERA